MSVILRQRMRLWVSLCCALVAVGGCTGPHSSGGLWAQQNLEHEAALFRLTDAQRADQAHQFELTLADQALASERTRLESELAGCPGPRQALTVSAGDRTRDGIRIRVQGDTARTATVAQLALADWRLRRAAATGDKTFCDDARTALSGDASADPAAGDLLSRLPAITVTRDASQSGFWLDSGEPEVALSQYALGYVDAVHALAPLPQYLALVYGGILVPAVEPIQDQEAAATTVDRAAPAYPEWEPDALYAAVRGGA